MTHAMYVAFLYHVRAGSYVYVQGPLSKTDISFSELNYEKPGTILYIVQYVNFFKGPIVSFPRQKKEPRSDRPFCNRSLTF